MISTDYISTFKKTVTYKLINDGVLKQDLQNVLLGNTPYRIAAQNEYIDTIPSQVIIGLHILITENKTTNQLINETLKSIPVTEKTICLLLDYIDTYLTYKESESELRIDYKYLLANIEEYKNKFVNLPCLSNLLASIYSKISL